MENPTLTGKVKFTTHAGAELIITQLSLYARQKLKAHAERMYPFPDSKQFERVREDIPSITGEPTVIPGQEHPDYQALLKEAQDKQIEAMNDLVLVYCVECEEAARWIEVYRHDLETLRGYADDLPEDEWLAVLKCFLVSNDDMTAIYAAINQSLPLTELEVSANGYAYFRLDLQGLRRSLFAGKQRASRPERAVENPA